MLEGIVECSLAGREDAPASQLWERYRRSRVRLGVMGGLRVLDASGEFLRASPWLAGAMACPSRMPGWDEATLIGEHRLRSIQPGQDTMKAEVEFAVLRAISQDSHGPILVGTRAGERVAVDTFVVVRTPFGWRITAPVRRPFLDAKGALAHLQFRDADRAFLDSVAGRGG